MIRLNYSLKIVLALVFSLIISGCSSSKLESLSPGATILAFGDSLTAGVGTTSVHSYPSVLQKLTGMKVINAGISGEVTAEGLKRFPKVLNETKPDLVILIEGGNDILRNKSLVDAERNLESMILLAQSRGIQVVIAGVPEKSLLSNSAPFYKDLAKRHNLAFEEAIIADLQRSPSLKSDLIHYNTEGYRQMAVAIHELLKNNGAL